MSAIVAPAVASGPVAALLTVTVASGVATVTIVSVLYVATVDVADGCRIRFRLERSGLKQASLFGECCKA